MHWPEFPEPVGVFRAVEKPTYERLVTDQIAATTEKLGKPDLDELFNAGDTWVVN